MKAFAGESMARNRYTFAAGQAKAQNLHVIEAVFRFTADQEKEHGEIFYNHLKDLAGEKIMVKADYPVATSDTVAQLLRAAQQTEFEEYDELYQFFGDVASKEGFMPVAESFYKIAEIEKTHGERFSKFADLLEQGKLFVSDIECKWICLNCGHIHEGKEAPLKCPVCSHDRGYFIRLELSPFEGKMN
jgi:rubrerythrin